MEMREVGQLQLKLYLICASSFVRRCGYFEDIYMCLKSNQIDVRLCPLHSLPIKIRI